MSEGSRLPYTWWIGSRYLRLRRDDRFIGFISAISMAGIAVGVAVLLVVLSVMNGFESELRAHILDVTAHATLEGLDGKLEHWQEDLRQTAQERGVRAVAPYVDGKGMLVNGAQSAGVELRGVDPAQESRVSSLARLVRGGSLDALVPGRYRIVLGRALATQLHARVGDRLLLVVPKAASRRPASSRGCGASRSPASSTRACTSSTADWPWSTWETRSGCSASVTR